MTSRADQPVGILIVDKPGGMTSRAVVDRVLRWFPRGTRAGHAGTLDPLATGVLVVCLGSATRLVEFIQRMKKTYRARLLLGATSPTDDAEGEISYQPAAPAPTEASVRHHLEQLIGQREQTPPSFSAAKVNGQRAYRLARTGKAPALVSKLVQIETVQLIDYCYPHLEIEVICGKGTYIRSIARDLGQQMGTGALIQSLRRTRIGPFAAADSVPLEANAAFVEPKLLPLAAAAAELPSVVAGSDALALFRTGRAVDLNMLAITGTLPDQKAEVAVFDELRRLAVLARLDPSQRTLAPRKVFV